MEKAQIQKSEALLVETALPWLAESDCDTEWQLVDGKDVSTGVVYRASVPKYGKIHKAQVIMACSAATAFQAVVKERKTHWIPNIANELIIHEEGGWDLMYYIASGMLGVSDREFISINFRRQISPGFYVSMGVSIDNPPLEKYNFKSPAKSVVRGFSHPGGFSLKQLNQPDQCLYTYIYNVDLKGFLPKTIVNLAAHKFLMRMVMAGSEFAKTLTPTGCILKDHLSCSCSGNRTRNVSTSSTGSRRKRTNSKNYAHQQGYN